jgi:hypothetical protein
VFTKAIAKQACVDYTVLSELCVDEIEQRIIRGYVRLVFQAVDADNSRSVVMRLGPLEVRLSEIPPKYAAFGLPPFWIEVFDGTGQDSIDSIGCHELDATRLTSAVEMILSAARKAGRRMIPPIHRTAT